MNNLLSVDTVFFTVLGYPMSYIEFVGTVLYLWSVWLIAKRHVLTWPVGIVSVLLYMAIFYQIRLYSDALEQVYYLGTSVYGWWYWSRSQQCEHTITDVSFSSRRTIFGWLCVTVVFSAILGGIMSHIHLWFPKLFIEAASYPYIDALTTIMSFVAMWLMARKHIESWVYWIVVDVIGIWLYFAKGVKFISLLYVMLLFLAIRGLADWINVRTKSQGKNEQPEEITQHFVRRDADRGD
jgi:nicotinamide mononucleotide transporter